MAFVFLTQFTVVKMGNLEYRLLSLIHFMIMIQLFPLVFVSLWDCSTKSIVKIWDFSIKMFWSLFHGSEAITVN